MKQALVLNAVCTEIGGVLIRGEKGTAKSTAVRALASLLPEIEVVAGCPYSCPPADPDRMCDMCRTTYLAGGSLPSEKRRTRMVDIPLNATEDMVIGSIDFGRAVRRGERALQHGLLAWANRGILYIDEVNLLDDHIVDNILDAAGSGVNYVEREGIGTAHPARFVLIGTMNPEEGELRPQLLDRFGLCVEVGGMKSPEERAELMALREKFDDAPNDFIDTYREEDARERERITGGREKIKAVALPGGIRTYISELCARHNVAGHRADIVMERSAVALAAYRGEAEVTYEDVRRVSPMVLRHRIREALPPQPPHENRKDNPERDGAQGREHRRESEESGTSLKEVYTVELPETGERRKEPDGKEPSGETAPAGPEKVYSPGEMYRVRRIEQKRDRKPRKGSGRRSRTRTPQKQGRYVKSALGDWKEDIAFDATLRAAAPFQNLRSPKGGGPAIVVREADLRCKIREKRIGNFFLFVVDASGSMGAQGRMIAAKGAVLSLLMDAYQKRDTVSLVVFRRKEAKVVLPPTSSVDRAYKILQDLPVGGRTPLSDALVKAHSLLTTRLRKEPRAKPIVVIVTDGKSNVAFGNGFPGEESLAIAAKLSSEGRVQYIVIDTESTGVVNFGYSRRLAMALGADYFKIEDLRARDLVEIVGRV